MAEGAGLEVAARGAVAAGDVGGPGGGALGRALRGLSGRAGRAVEEERRRVPAPGAPRAARVLLRRRGGGAGTLLYYGPPLADAASRSLGVQMRPFREGRGDDGLPALLGAVQPPEAAATSADKLDLARTSGTEWDIPVRFPAEDLRAGGGAGGDGSLEGTVTVGVYAVTTDGGGAGEEDPDFRLMEARARVAEGAHIAAAKSIRSIAQLLKPYVDLRVPAAS